MSSAVHVAVYGKFYIAALVHIEDLDTVMVIQRTTVRIVLVIEREDHREPIGHRVIAKQLSPIGKYHGISIGALHHVHIFIRDPQENLIIGIHPPGIRDLRHGPLIIQQIHSLRGISDAIVFFHAIIYLIFPLTGRHYKIHQQGSNVPIHLYQAQGSCSLLGRLQVPPGNLLEIAVDVHFVKSTVIRQFRIRFQVFSQFLCRFFVIQFPMEIRCELQDLCDMQVVVPQNRRIIVDLLFPFQFQDQGQAVLCIDIDQVF